MNRAALGLRTVADSPALRRAGRRRSVRGAFTLLEVMFAVAIFSVAVFAILELVSRNLRNARALQFIPVDATSLAADLSLTNSLSEGSDSGDFGDLYPGSTWRRDILLYASNGLYQVDFTINWNLDGHASESKMSILLYRPGSTIRSRGLRGRP